MNPPFLTVFTPSFNRAHTLPRLFDSLRAQSCRDFEWVVVDDGSTDGTHELVQDWCAQSTAFPIIYRRVENGGKNRAINQGLRLARGTCFMILDSDDLLTPDAVEWIKQSALQVADNELFVGFSGKRGGLNGVPLGCESGSYDESGFVDCSNLERARYGLQRDMAEVFFTERLRRYEFKVWEEEKFTPEEVVWNRIALDGYRLRWFNKVIYLCEYQEGGLSDSTWQLLRRNPMGYAMMYDQRLEIYPSMRARLNNALQYGCCCLLAGQGRMLSRSRLPLLTMLVAPAAWLLACRRRRQFKKIGE